MRQLQMTFKGTLHQLDDRPKREAVMHAITDYNIAESGARDDLDMLPVRTVVESVEASPERIFEAGEDGFAAVATVYISLASGESTDDHFIPDSFPAYVEGHFENGDAVIDNLSIDTSSFYD